MHNKKLLYFLIPAVLTIWGLIAYRVTSQINGNEKVINNIIPNSIEKNRTENFQFILHNNYRDPFLGIKKVTTSRKKTNYTTSKIQTNPIDFYDIQKRNEMVNKISYGGMIQGNGKKEILGLFKIKGQNYFLKKKQIIESIEIINLYKDSSRIRYKGYEKTIIKNK